MTVSLVWNSGLQQADYVSGSFDVNHPSNPTAGNLLTVEIVHYVSDTSSCVVSDSEDGTWTRVAQQLNGSSVLSSEIWARANVAASSGTFTITLTLETGFDNYVSWAAQEWSGIEASPLKTTGAALGDWGDTITVTTSGGTTPAVGDLIISNIVSLQGSSDNGYTPPSGYTTLFVEQNSSSHQGGIASYRTVPTAGHQTVDVEATASMYRGGVLAVFAAAGGTNGTATGQTITASSSVIPGSATGGATMAGVTLAVAASLIAGAGSGQVSPTAQGSTATASTSMLAGSATGQSNATASGATLVATASMLDGDAAGQTNASFSGVTLTSAVSIVEGAASGQRNETATGSTSSAASSLVAGGAQGQRSETASGQVLSASLAILAGGAGGEVNATASGAASTASTSFTPGSANGQRNEVASGATPTAAASLIGGDAQGQRNEAADGKVIAASASLIGGDAEGTINPTVEGATLEAASSMLGGTATGQRSVTAAAPTLIAVSSITTGSATATRNPTAAGATITAASSIVAGTASGQDNSTAAGATFTATASVIPGGASGSTTAVASGATMTATALIVPGGAFALLPGTPTQQTRTYARTTSRDKDLPAIPTSVESTLRGPLERIREAVQRLMGLRGTDGRAAVLWDDLEAEGLGIASRRRIQLDRAVADVVGSLPGGGAGSTTPDLTPPPVPTGLSVTAGFGHVFLEWDAPVYTQGHGHKQTNIYATKQASDDTDLFVITDAVKVSTEPGALTVASLPSDLGIKWRIWIKWESTDGIESAPAGGVNGFVATTGRIGNADLGPLIVQAENLALGAVDLETGLVTADGQFGALAVGYTVTQYLVATSGILGNLIVDNAQISALSAAKLTVGDGTVGGNLKSTNYNNSLALGWLVRPDGYAEFNNVVIRGATYTGTIYANAGTIGGITIAAGYMRAGQLGFNNGSGFYLGSDGRLSVGNSSGRRIVWDGTNLEIFANGLSISSGSASFSGSVNASSGEIGGIIIGADNIRSSNYVAATSGWQARADGTAEFNGVVYSRNMVIAQGLHQVYQDRTWMHMLEAYPPSDFGDSPAPPHIYMHDWALGQKLQVTHPWAPGMEGSYHPSWRVRLLGTYMINTGYSADSWKASTSALIGVAGLQGGLGETGGMMAWGSGFPSDPVQLMFKTELVQSWAWGSSPTIYLRVSVIGYFHVSVDSFRLFASTPPGGIAWKLYKVT